MSVILYNGYQRLRHLIWRTRAITTDAAWHIAQVSAVDPCFGLAEAHLLCKQPPDLAMSSLVLSPEEVRLAIACETEALSQDAATVNSEGVNVSTYTDCNGYATTRGANGVDEYAPSDELPLIAQGRDKNFNVIPHRRQTPDALIPPANWHKKQPKERSRVRRA